MLCDPDNIEFHLLGYGYRPLRGVVNHGAYRLDQLEEKLNSIKPHVVWFLLFGLRHTAIRYQLRLTMNILLSVRILVLLSSVSKIENNSLLLPWNIKPIDCAAFWRAYAQGAKLSNFLVSAEICDEIERDDNFYQR